MSAIFNTIRTDLHNRFGHSVDTATIDALLDETYQRHLVTAVIKEFVPVLVERDVTEQLNGTGLNKRQRVIFVSRDDRSLADAAVALVNRMSHDVVATSAATHPENFGNDALESVLAERGLARRASDRDFGPRTERVLDAADVVVYMTDREDQDVPGIRQVVWDFGGIEAATIEQARELADDLEIRVMRMLNTLAPRTVGPALAA